MHSTTQQLTLYEESGGPCYQLMDTTQLQYLHPVAIGHGKPISSEALDACTFIQCCGP